MAKYLKFIVFYSLVLVVCGVSSFAQSNRVYVAESGSDANQCTSAAPCRTIVQALTFVNAGGEVVITENGEYTPFSVNKSVTVSAAPGIEAVIRQINSYAVLIFNTAPTDTVTIRNLQLKGGGADSTSIGIRNISAGTVFIDHCVLTNFDNGISSSAAGQVFVHDTSVRSSLFGIVVSAPATEGTVRATIDKCIVQANDTGILITSKVAATISNTIASNNTSRAVQVRATNSSQLAQAMIDNCVFNGNTVGLLLTGTSGAIARLSRTTINNSALAGVSVGAGNIVYTLQNNSITGNASDVNGVLTPLALK